METRAGNDVGDGASANGLPDTLRAGFEWLPIGVLMATAEGTIVLVNRALEQMCGYAAPELIGQTVEVLVPDAMRVGHATLRGGYMRQPEARAMGPGRELFARRKDGSEVAVEVGLTPIPVGERWLVLASLVDISERRRAQSELRSVLNQRIDFETLVGELAAQFVNLRPDEVDPAIEDALGRLVRLLDLDRSALFQLDETGDFVHTHQWTRPGWAAPPPRVSAAQHFPWHLARIRDGALVTFSTVDDVPDPIDRDSLRQLGTRSGVTIPLVIREQIWGAVTFATVGESRRWTSEQINRLRVVAVIFANVLSRKQSDERLRQAMVENTVLRERLRDENAYLRHELHSLTGAPAIVGNSPAIRRVLEHVRQVAPTGAPVLLLGETGTGKSVLAHRIHELSERREHALVRVNCASLTVAALEGDMLARGKGRALGSTGRHIGLLELAHGSTVFLDEVADLPADTQACLARVLQQEEIRPPGHLRPINVNLRVISASRRDLAQQVQDGKFRDDLYYLLNVVPIHIPPLRERPEDIPLLVWRFVDEFAPMHGMTIDAIEQDSMALLQHYKWPGNARELRNVVERAIILATGRRLRITHPSALSNGAHNRDTLAATEKAHIIAVMAACGGKVDSAAARLGITPRGLERKLAKHGLGRRAT